MSSHGLGTISSARKLIALRARLLPRHRRVVSKLPHLDHACTAPTFRDAHHNGCWPQQLAVAWDRRADRRTRRTLLHLQYSYAAPFGPAILVTQGTKRKRLAYLLYVGIGGAADTNLDCRAASTMVGT
jgi:hypothetical protein